MRARRRRAACSRLWVEVGLSLEARFDEFFEWCFAARIYQVSNLALFAVDEAVVVGGWELVVGVFDSRNIVDLDRSWMREKRFLVFLLVVVVCDAVVSQISKDASSLA